MFKGIAFAVGACFIWGWIFVIPQFMSGFTSIEVALGRNLFYGMLSTLIFCKSKFQGKCCYSRAIWIKAFYFSLIATLGYYTFVVLALRLSTPATCTLVLGISPITIAFYGNWKKKEIAFRSLITPSILIVLGLVIINIPYIEKSNSVSSYVLGLLCSVVALIGWSWCAVANSRFLKQHPELHSSNWATLIGVVTLFWVLVFTLLIYVFFESHLEREKYFTPSLELTRFLIGSAILGLLCSWVGAYLWNRACLYLPVSLAGQLTIFETIFGVLFIYILQHHFPPLIESIGIFILLIAIVYGIRKFKQQQAYNNQLTPR